MICKKCNNQGILNTVNGQDFYYCRTCKVEIFLEDATKQVSNQPNVFDIDGNFTTSPTTSDPNSTGVIYFTGSTDHSWNLQAIFAGQPSVCDKCGIDYGKYVTTGNPLCTSNNSLISGTTPIITMRIK